MIKKGQQGSIIIYTILIMFVMTTLTIAMVKLFVPKLRIVREAVYSTSALYAADSAMELCLFTTRIDTSAMASPPTMTSLATHYLGSGITITSIPANCPYTPSGSVSARVVGRYRGISRSLEIF